MTKVAVITRTKDRTLFLKRAIASVSDQTFKDYVHVIVNDGGDSSEVDNLVAIQDDEVKSRIRVFHREAASNAPDTIFNESIDRVDSEYVAIHDSDDTWHPDFLKLTVEMLDGGARGVVVRTDKVTESIDGGVLHEKKREHYMPDLRAVSLYRQCIDNQLTPISFIYARSAYVAAGKYDDTLPVVGDWEFGVRFLQKFDVEYLDPGFPLAAYHHRADADNSFAEHNHRKHINKIQNKYLREDLDRGALGVGYLMSSLRYEQDMFASIAKKILPKRLAGLIKGRVRQ